MTTIVYLIRHSEPLKYININNSDSLQIQNEKWILTENGEKIAKTKSLNIEFNDIDIVYSSNYVRAIATAKYFSKDKINVDEDFGERKFGINKWEELPENFEYNQFKNFNYKLPNGESLNEVISRETYALYSILKLHKNKKIVIVGHSTAFTALLSKWCEVSYTGGYKFNGKDFFDGKWNYCQTFKLEFDDKNKLLSIKVVE